MKLVFTFFGRKNCLLFILFLLTGFMASAQLKIGSNPTVIEKSSILELESSRQGLLLPRLADTTAINLLTPPDGMIIFLTTDQSLRVRSNSGWRRIADSTLANTTNWALKGNIGTDSALNFIGTIDGKPLTIKTNNLARLIVASNGNVGIGTTTPTAQLNVNGSVKLESLPTSTTEIDVLVLGTDGTVSKRTMSSAAFTNAIKAINGIQKETLSITADTSLAANVVTVQNRTADSTIAIYLPVQNGASGTAKPYGLLSYSDWQKIDSAVTTIAIGAVSALPNVNAASITTTNDSTRTLTLHAADANNPGVVTATAQTFGGSKTFRDSIFLNGPVTLNSISDNSSEDSVLVINNGLVQKRQLDQAAFGNTIRNINGNRDSVQVIAFTNTGTDLTVSTVNSGLDSIFLNVPDADVAARGVVTTTSQNFAGAKHFTDSVGAGVALLVGSQTGNANSTVQVNGSVSMAIKTVTSAYTLTATDNTVLADATSAAITVTLPSPTGIAGRIYTIKKVGTGDIDKALTISPNGGTIDGGTSLVIYNDYSYVSLQTDGTNWFIIKK